MTGPCLIVDHRTNAAAPVGAGRIRDDADAGFQADLESAFGLDFVNGAIEGQKLLPGHRSDRPIGRDRARSRTHEMGRGATEKARKGWVHRKMSFPHTSLAAGGCPHSWKRVRESGATAPNSVAGDVSACLYGPVWPGLQCRSQRLDFRAFRADCRRCGHKRRISMTSPPG